MLGKVMKPVLIGFVLLVMMVTAAEASGLALQNSSKLAEGNTAPIFRVTSLEGESLDSSQLRGQVLVLNFWFIECPPCRAEIPRLNEMVKAYRERQVRFIAFTPNDASSLREFLAQVPFHYEVVADATPVAVEFGVTGAPTHVIVDPEGRIAKVFLGEVSSPISQLGPVIDRLLTD